MGLNRVNTETKIFICTKIFTHSEVVRRLRRLPEGGGESWGEFFWDLGYSLSLKMQ